MAIGHIIKRALNESDTAGKDRLILDNLTSEAGVGASADIELFINNFRNTSTIYSDEYELDGELIILTNATIIPFANNNKIQVDGITAYVYESNGIDKFKLRRVNGSSYIPTGDIVRNDSVTYENILNLSPDRYPSTKTSNDSNQTELSAASVVSESGTENITDIYGQYSINSLITEIDNVVNNYIYKKSNSILLNKENLLYDKLEIEGSVKVLNLDEFGNKVQIQETLEDTDSGVYIISEELTPLRAFGDNTNPWDTTTNGGYNTTQSTQMTVGNIFLTDPDITGPTVTTIPSTSIDATHKIPVMVNGELYYLLLTE